MTQVDLVQPNQFRGPAGMRKTIAPFDGHIYHETDTGLSFKGNGTHWVRAWTPGAFQTEAPFPGFGEVNMVKVSPEMWHRTVTLTVRLQASTTTDAIVRAWVEGEADTWHKTEIGTTKAPGLPVHTLPFRFDALGNRRYWFERGGGSGVLEQVIGYHYLEF